MWFQIINAALGIWLMCAPVVLGYYGMARMNDHIVGPLAATFAIVAASEVMRPIRLLNVASGLWLCIVPWALGYNESAAIINSMGVGLLLIAFALVRGHVRHRFAGGWSSLLPSNESKADAAK